MSTINYTYNVIVDRFRQFADGHFQLRRFTHGEISQADLEKEAEWPWLHVKPRSINYSPGTRTFSFEVFISDLPRDKEDKTGYQAESITDCSLIFQDLINEIYLGNMFGTDVVLTRPVNSEPFVEQYTHTLTGVTGIVELSLDYDWSACSIPASWNYNTPTNSGSDGWGALQFIESLDQNGVFVSLDGDVEAPGNSYYYGTNASGIKGWYQLIDNVGITCEDLPECATIISIVDDIAGLQTDVALKANTADLGATAFSNDYNDLDNLPTIPSIAGLATVTYVDTQDNLKVDKIAGKGLSTNDYTTAEQTKLAGIQAGAEVNVNADWNAVSGDAQILNKPTIPSIVGLVPETRTLTINGTTQDLSANRTFTIASNPGTVTSVAALTLGTTGTDLSSTVANSTTTPVITLNVPTASATNRGVLSSTDWSTFNGKFTLPSLTSGSVLFSNGTTIAQNNSQLFWDNTNNRLGVGTSSPAVSLSIFGTIRATNPATLSAYPQIYTSAGNFPIFEGYGNGITLQTVSSYSTANGAIRIYPQANSPVILGTTSGNNNTLIGTTTDAGYKLDVNGTARVSGILTLSNTVNGSNSNWNVCGASYFNSIAPNPSGLGGIFLYAQTITSVSSQKLINLTPTFNQTSGTAANTDIFLNRTTTAVGSGVQLLMDLQHNSSSIFSVSTTGAVQINSTTQGFLPPRMTTTQKNAIASPVAGLVVYDSTLNKLCVYTGAAWQTITSI